MQENKPSELSISQKKEWAKELFTRDDMTQKAIAEKVGVSEQSMSAWVRDEKWDTMRKTLLSTRKEQLTMLYDILDGLNRQGVASLNDDDPETNPNPDAIIKITNAIKKLEKETGVGEMIDTARAFITFVQREDFEAAKIINKWFDLFIKDRLASLNK